MQGGSIQLSAKAQNCMLQASLLPLKKAGTDSCNLAAGNALQMRQAGPVAQCTGALCKGLHKDLEVLGHHTIQTWITRPLMELPATPLECWVPVAI